jgi:hypothetical protein
LADLPNPNIVRRFASPCRARAAMSGGRHAAPQE